MRIASRAGVRASSQRRARSAALAAAVVADPRLPAPSCNAQDWAAASAATSKGAGVTDGINSGPLAGPDGSEMPATGRRVSLLAAGVYTIRDGRIARTRYYWDNVSFLNQIGLM